jgi:two-component system response regulator (stage 0 sporulation protein F)
MKEEIVMESKKFTILLAEDEEASRLLYTEELEEAGFNVLTAANGLQALGLLEDVKVDLLMTDIKMPDMHALELIPRVREEHPNLPILVASAFKGMEDDFALKGCRIQGFFTKPVNLDALKAEMLRILESQVIVAA